MHTEIKRLTYLSLTDALKTEISTLFKQLSPNKKQISLKDVLQPDNNNHLVICTHEDRLLGIASLCCYNVISGKKGWIEDVVVESGARGQGIGRKLINELLLVAKEQELSEVLLFTEDHRLPAIKLYQSLGFKPKETRIYSISSF